MPELPSGYRWRLAPCAIAAWKLKLQKKYGPFWETVDTSYDPIYGAVDLNTDIEKAAQRILKRQAEEIKPDELYAAMEVVNGRH